MISVIEMERWVEENIYYEWDDRESRMYFMSMWVGIIDNDGLTEDELKARAYELYKQDQNRKENGTKYR